MSLLPGRTFFCLALTIGGLFVPSVLAQTPADPESTLKQAAQFHQSGDFARAIVLYREFLKTRPSSPEVLSNLGAALAHEGRYSEAIAEYTKALKLQPRFPQALANLAIAFYKTNQIPQAREKLEAVRPMMARNQQILFLLADCDLRLGDNKAAIALLEPLEQTLGQDEGFDFLFGNALIRDRQTERGRIFIDRILSRGDTAEVRLMLGTTELDRRDFAAAREDLEKAVGLNPNLPEAHAYLGLALAAIGDAQNATEAFQTELKLNPTNFLATFQLGAIAITEHRNGEGRHLFERCLTLRPGDWGARYQIATLDLAEGHLEKARSALEALIKESPGFTAAHVQLATLYYRLQRKPDGDRERDIVRKLNAEAQAAQPGVTVR